MGRGKPSDSKSSNDTLPVAEHKQKMVNLSKKPEMYKSDAAVTAALFALIALLPSLGWVSKPGYEDRH